MFQSIVKSDQDPVTQSNMILSRFCMSDILEYLEPVLLVFNVYIRYHPSPKQNGVLIVYRKICLDSQPASSSYNH